jgi:hypothetical protein
MRVSIAPVEVDGTICVEANVYVAVSGSAAIRVVPVSPDGVERPAGAVGIVGASSDVEEFVSSVTAAVGALLASRGI